MHHEELAVFCRRSDWWCSAEESGRKSTRQILRCCPHRLCCSRILSPVGNLTKFHVSGYLTKFQVSGRLCIIPLKLGCSGKYVIIMYDLYYSVMWWLRFASHKSAFVMIAFWHDTNKLPDMLFVSCQKSTITNTTTIINYNRVVSTIMKSFQLCTCVQEMR